MTKAVSKLISRFSGARLIHGVSVLSNNEINSRPHGFNCCAIGLGIRVFTQPGSFADMQQSLRERPLPCAKQTYLGQPRVGRRAYGKELFSVYLRFVVDSGRFSDLGDRGLRGYTEKI